MPARQPRTRAAAAACCLLAVVCAACSPASSSTGTKGYISGTGAITVFDSAQRKPAPVLHGIDLNGKPIVIRSSSEFSVINVWASWCGPCRAEADDLVQAVQRLPAVTFYGVDIRDVRAAATAFVRRFHLPYPSLFDPSGSSLLGFHDAVSITSPPTTLVLDGQGRVAAVISGELTASTLVGLVHDLSRQG
jgi:thiol-disulfide isomerase/thioredoxin